jgi:hypothetical protein
MGRDIDGVLQGWDYKPDVVQARLVQADDGRQVIQMRVELGVLQLEIAGRPDGARPHNFPNYFAYLRHQATVAEEAGEPFVLGPEQCQEADREFVQFYHRRVCWLALRNYARAVTDADHTLAFMDFVKSHSPGEEYTLAHEQYRGLVLFHRTQASAARAAEKDDPEGAVDAIRDGLERLRHHFAAFDLEDRMDEDGMVRQLRRLEKTLRESHGIEATLQEKLDAAIAAEDYETAARLRDQIRKQT